MFDVGFWELIVIGVVALVVIGPDKLPGVARTAGMWVGRTRRFVTQVKTDIDRELRQEELRKALEREAGLDEIKRIMDPDRYTLEDEEPKPQYQVKAIPDEPEHTAQPSGHSADEHNANGKDKA
ncbi:MAG: Sec-independent protein translocase protein TatB [Gammaproteobacteria bacterium]|nr:Sec-independent protein translocase protein TatB [Gammaproteobacteria bacterium]MDH5650247.1 Sec-independent protein translocase protein TatB [Gammaproteobacteria bacterium]